MYVKQYENSVADEGILSKFDDISFVANQSHDFMNNNQVSDGLLVCAIDDVLTTREHLWEDLFYGMIQMVST